MTPAQMLEKDAAELAALAAKLAQRAELLSFDEANGRPPAETLQAAGWIYLEAVLRLQRIADTYKGRGAAYLGV